MEANTHKCIYSAVHRTVDTNVSYSNVKKRGGSTLTVQKVKCRRSVQCRKTQ